MTIATMSITGATLIAAGTAVPKRRKQWNGQFCLSELDPLAKVPAGRVLDGDFAVWWLALQVITRPAGSW